MMLSPPFAGKLLDGAARHHFVQQRLLVAVLTQKTAQSLDVLADRAAAGQNDADIGRWHIDAFVEDTAGDNHIILPSVERLQNVAALFGPGLMGDGRHQEAPGDLIDCGIVISKYKHTILAMTIEQFFQAQHLGRRRQDQAALFTVRLKSGTASTRTARFLNETLPTVGTAEVNAVLGAEAAIMLARLLIALLFLGRQLDVEPFGAIFGEEIAGQFPDLAAIDDGTDQGCQQVLLPILALGSGGQSQTKGSEAAARRFQI